MVCRAALVIRQDRFAWNILLRWNTMACCRAPAGGLSAIIPWEGMSDYYRDRCRHGGILSDKFIALWWNRQVITNQYGKPGRKGQKLGPRYT